VRFDDPLALMTMRGGAIYLTVSVAEPSRKRPGTTVRIVGER
jgi:hypothetical protein